MDSLNSYCSFFTLRLSRQNTNSSGFGDFNVNDKIIFLTAGKKSSVLHLSSFLKKLQKLIKKSKRGQRLYFDYYHYFKCLKI